MPSPLRIFVSSPGDVIPERRRATLVIEKLAKNYARFFAVEAILWELEPMLASGHFQDQITPPSEADILVLIVWSRLGTSLPEKTATREYHGIDGRSPVTGTEWEFEDAMAAQKKRGAPDLLAYRKQADLTVSLKDKSAVATAEQQWEKLDAFWNRWFVNRGEFRAAFAEFADLDSFEAKLESDLRVLIERRIQNARAAGHEPSAAIWLSGSPFRGLQTYRFEHAPIFFGRNSMTKNAVEQLTGNAESGRAFLLILGASGAGKSSLAQAGVLPALTGRGIVPRVGQWRHAVMHPGGHPQGPFAALAEALVARSALPELLAPNQDAAALANHLRAAADDPCFPIVATLNQIEAASRAHGDLLEIESTRLAVVADQLEELFTASEVSAADRMAFIRCLEAMARSARIFVIATMRNDYWHRAAEIPLLVEMAAGRGRLDLLPPAKDEIIEMIRQPAEAAGIDFENDPVREVRLDATLGAEAEANPSALPLLSFLLDELYKRDVKEGGRSTLTYASMQQLGGLNGAIANRAEAAFTTLPIDVQAALPTVLRALVTVSRSGAEATARVASMSLFPQGSLERRLIDALIDPQVRLMAAEGDGAGARVRLAHEALITHWERAKRQIAQDRDDLRTRAVVEEALAEWRNADAHNRRDYMLRDPQLANAVDLAGRWRAELDAETLGFIETSQQRARLLHRLTMAAAAVFGLVAVIAVAATVIAWGELGIAKAQKSRADSLLRKVIVSFTENVRDTNPATAAALSLEGLWGLPLHSEPPDVLHAERSLMASLQVMRERATLRGHTWTITNVAFSPDGRTLLTSSWDHSIRLWDTATWKERLKLDDGAGAITIATFSPDGRYVLAAPNDGTARIFDANTGAVVHRLIGTKDELWDAAYSPNGARILTVANDKSPRLWDAHSGHLVAALIGHTDNVSLSAFSRDSNIVVTVGAEQVIKAWRSSDGHLLFDISGLPAKVKVVAFSPDGRYLASACEDGSVQLWDAATGASIRTMNVPNTSANALAFSPDGERLAVAYNDQIARVWQVASGQKVLDLTGHAENVWWVVYGPDGRLIATTSADKTARLWDAETGRAVAILRGHTSPVRRAAFSPDGRWLATNSGQGFNVFDRNPDNTARVWDLQKPLEIGAVREARHILAPGAVSPNGALVAVQDASAFSDQAKLSAPAQLWNADTHEDLGELTVGGNSIEHATASPDGSRVITIDRNGVARLWDATTALGVGAYESSKFSAYLAAFSSDGATVALAVTPRNFGSASHDIVLLRSNDGGQIAVLSGPSSDVGSLLFSADGKLLLAAISSFGSDRGFRVWSLADGADPTAIVKDDNLSAAAFVDGDKVIVTTDDNGKVQTWRSDTGDRIAVWDATADFGTTTDLAPGGRTFVRMTPNPDNNEVTIHIVDIGSGRDVTVPVSDGANFSQCVFAPDGRRFAIYSDEGHIHIFQTDSGQLVGDLTTTTKAPRKLQFSNGGTLFAIGAADGVIELRQVGADSSPQRLISHSDAITSLTFSPNDAQLLSGSADTTARLWDVAAGKQVAVLQAHGTSLSSATFVSASHRILTLGSEDPAATPQKAVIVDAHSGKAVAFIVLVADSSFAPTAINSMVFSESGDRILVNGSMVYDSRTGKLLLSQPSDEGLSTDGGAISSSGKLIAWRTRSSGGGDSTQVKVEIVDIASKKVLKTIAITDTTGDAFDTGRDTFEFSPDDRYLMANGRIWSVETGEEWRDPTAGENPQLTFSPDGKLLAVIAKAPIVPDPLQHAAAVSDPHTGRLIYTLGGNSSAVSAVAVDSSGKLVVTAADEALKLWDINSGRQRGIIDLKQQLDTLSASADISHIAFSPDGRRLAVVHSEKLRILDVANRTEIGSVAVDPDVDRIGYSPDGSLIAASTSGLSGQGLRLWRATDLKPIVLPQWRVRFRGTPFAFSPDGSRMVCGPGEPGTLAGTQTLVIDTSNGGIIGTLRGHNFQVNAVAYSPDGKWIATASNDDKLHLWDASSFAEVVIATGHSGGINDLAFSPDSRIIAIAAKDKTISLWDVETWKLLRTLTGHEAEVNRISFIEKGVTLVSVGGDRTIRSWKVNTGEQLAKILHRGPITDVALADNVIISANADPRETEQLFQLSLWDTATRGKLNLGHQANGKFNVLISRDQRYLLIQGSGDPVLYNINTKQRVANLAEPHSTVGNSATFAPDGNTLLTYSSIDGAFVWRTSDGKLLGVAGRLPQDFQELLNGPKVKQAEFVSGGRRFFTYASNGVVRLWDLAQMQLLATISDDDARSFAAALDGRRLIAAFRDGSVRFSDLPESPQELVTLACRLLPGPLTRAEREAYGLDPTPEHFPCDLKPQ